MTRTVALLLLAVALTLTFAGVADACPTCKDAVPVYPESGATAGGLSGGMKAGIYLLLGSVLLVGGFLVRMILRSTTLPAGPSPDPHSAT